MKTIVLDAAWFKAAKHACIHGAVASKQLAERLGPGELADQYRAAEVKLDELRNTLTDIMFATGSNTAVAIVQQAAETPDTRTEAEKAAA